MPKEKVTSTQHHTGILFTISFLVMMVVNAAVLYLANMFFPQEVVLGTMSITHTWAIVLSAGALALINILVLPFLGEWELRMNRQLKPTEMLAVFLAVNFLAVWLVTRVAEVFGLGVTSWLVVLVLAVVIDVAQGAAMMVLEQFRTRK